MTQTTLPAPVARPARDPAALLACLRAELAAFAVRGSVLDLATRLAAYLAPVREGRLPPRRESEADSPSGLIRMDGRVPLWRVTERGASPLRPAQGRAFNVGAAHASILLAPPHTGLPVGPGLLCACDDPRMLALWFPELRPELRVDLWLADPARCWSDHALQAIFDPLAGELVGALPLAEVHGALPDLASEIEGAASDLWDLGFCPGGLHARWEMACVEAILGGHTPAFALPS